MAHLDIRRGLITRILITEIFKCFSSGSTVDVRNPSVGLLKGKWNECIKNTLSNEPASGDRCLLPTRTLLKCSLRNLDICVPVSDHLLLLKTNIAGSVARSSHEIISVVHCGLSTIAYRYCAADTAHPPHFQQPGGKMTLK